MPYVALKHLLAELALEATRQPEQARWVPVLAAYAALASPKHLTVSWTDLQAEATPLAERFGWPVTPSTLAPLVHVRLLEDADGAIRVAPTFASYFGYLRQHATRVMDLIGQLHPLQVPPTVPDALARGAILFNSGLFFECHEYLEVVWRADSGPAREFYHGLIQVAAAFYHYEKRNWHGARTLLAKGLQRLASYPGEFLGVRLDALRQALVPWLEAFSNERSPTGTGEQVPRVEFSSRPAVPTNLP
jgi:hypothetical protein